MQVVVNSLLVNYSAKGNGKTILLIHGWGDNSAGLNKLQELLSKNYRVINFDLPGFGNSQAAKTSWGLSDFAQFINDFVKKIDATLYAIVGHSNGGAIAIKALSSGVEAKNLVLVASSGIRGENKGSMAIIKTITKLGKIVTKPLPGKVKKQLRSKLYNSIGSEMLVAEHMQETFKKIVNEDIRLDAQKITVPTLLVYGQNDTTTPISFGQTFNKLIKNSKLEIVIGAGHMLPSEDPTQVSQLILGFIK